MDKINLSNQAILVELNISIPSFTKLDKAVSKEVTTSKGADDDSARVNKHLFAGVEQLQKYKNWVAATRAEFYARTMPWSDSGLRLCDIRSFITLKDWLNDKEVEATNLTADFIVIYPSLVSAQAFRMGTMFNRAEYPDPSDIVKRFGFKFCFTPLPERGDFRVDVGHELAEELEKEYSRVYEERTSVAMKDLWDRLYKVTKQISDRYADDAEGEKKRIHDSVMDNAVELCEMLKVMNVTQDADLDWARQKLEEALMGVTTEDLKKSDGLRKDVKSRVDELADKLGW